MEAELELEEPTEIGDDVSALVDKGDRGAIVTLVEHYEPIAASISGERYTEARRDVPKSRKHAMSEDTTIEREAKQAWSPRPLEASLASHQPTLSVVEHAGRSGGCDRSPTSSGSACMRDLHRRDAPSVTPVVLPQAGGRGRSRADQELARLAPPSVDTRGHGS